MQVVGVQMILNQEGQPIDPDGVTDILEILSDEMDDAGFIPEISTSATSEGTRLSIEVVTDSSAVPVDLLRAFLDALSSALEKAKIEIPNFPQPTDFKSEVRDLQPA